MGQGRGLVPDGTKTISGSSAELLLVFWIQNEQVGDHLGS